MLGSVSRSLPGCEGHAPCQILKEILPWLHPEQAIVLRANKAGSATPLWSLTLLWLTGEACARQLRFMMCRCLHRYPTAEG